MGHSNTAGFIEMSNIPGAFLIFCLSSLDFVEAKRRRGGSISFSSGEGEGFEWYYILLAVLGGLSVLWSCFRCYLKMQADKDYGPKLDALNEVLTETDIDITIVKQEGKVGLTILNHLGYRVDKIQKGGPAERSGLQYYDKIVKINGKSTENMNFEECIAEVSNVNEGQVNLQVRRLVARERINESENRMIKTVTLSKISGKYGFCLASKDGVLSFSSVRENGSAAINGVKEGDIVEKINDLHFESLEEAVAEVSRTQDNLKIELLCQEI